MEIGVTLRSAAGNDKRFRLAGANFNPLTLAKRGGCVVDVQRAFFAKDDKRDSSARLAVPRTHVGTVSAPRCTVDV